MKISKIYRQGDVLLVCIETLPADIEAEQHDTRIVLAYGEVTGHAHVIDAREAQAFRPTTPTRLLNAQVERFLQVQLRAVLRHEEHAPIALPAGKYAVIQQREYSPEEIRRVAD